jgi:hypothetical protein
MEWFVDDDEGYRTWLEAHPDAYVLNTYARPNASYLVLHRVGCRSVNRPPADGRRWTHEFGKACADDRADLIVWAFARTGAKPSPCGICSPVPSSERGPVAEPAGPATPATPVTAAATRGSRAPRDRDCRDEVACAGEPVRIVVECDSDATGTRRPPLVIEGAQWLAEVFFRCDPSAVGDLSYDTWIEKAQRDPHLRDHVVHDDVTAVNRTMAARSPHERWAPIIEDAEQSWLAALNPGWDLFELDARAWAKAAPLLRAAFAAVRRPGIGLAVATKVLHVKRPRLIPVLDSLVLEQAGAVAGVDQAGWMKALERVRAVGRANLAELASIRGHLGERGLPERTPVRILDAILWTSHPGSFLYPRLSGWERVLRVSDRGRS